MELCKSNRMYAFMSIRYLDVIDRGMPHKAELTLESTALFWTSKDGRLNYITWDEVLMAMPALVRPRTARRYVAFYAVSRRRFVDMIPLSIGRLEASPRF